LRAYELPDEIVGLTLTGGNAADLQEGHTMFQKSIGLAFHLVALGGLTKVVLLMEKTPELALIQTVAVCVCLLLVAGALHLALKLVNKK
jgi:hypothetical protein